MSLIALGHIGKKLLLISNCILRGAFFHGVKIGKDQCIIAHRDRLRFESLKADFKRCLETDLLLSKDPIQGPQISKSDPLIKVSILPP